MGDSASPMNDDQYKEEKIELPPPSPKLQTDGVSQWMDWSVTVQRPTSPQEIERLEHSLARKGIATHFSGVGSTNMSVEVKQSPIGDYTDLYEASIRALYRLEQLTGTLASIEDIPRPKWELQFVMTQRFGGLDV